MKQRRVGTYTLGLSLILIGIIIPIGLINMTYCMKAVQFAPLLLVALGIEILIYAFCFKEDKLKYDGLSIFLIISITIVSMIVGACAPAFVRYSERYFEGENEADNIRTELYRAADKEGFIAECRVWQSYDNAEFFFSKNPRLRFHADVSLKTDKLTDETKRAEVVSMLYKYASELNVKADSFDYISIDLSGRNTDKIQSHGVVINDENLKRLSPDYIDYELFTNVNIGNNFSQQIAFYGAEDYEERIEALREEFFPEETITADEIPYDDFPNNEDVIDGADEPDDMGDGEDVATSSEVRG